MTILQILYKDLDKYMDLNITGNVDKFLDTIEQIILHKDPSSIPILLKYFKDDRKHNWVFESLMLNLEYYDETTHIKALLENLPILVPHSPLWANDIFNRIFNEETCKRIFINNMHLAPKGDLQNLFDIMEKESPHHHELIKELRAKLRGE